VWQVGVAMKKVAIIGGGLSGLSLAYYLQKEDFNITIFEKDRIGGLIQSKNLGQDGFIESAANGFLGHPEILRIADEIGAHPVHASKKLGRFIFRKFPRKWPISLKATLRLMVVLFFWLFFRSKVKPQPKESMRQWGDRIFGEEVTSFLVEPALRGIFAGDLDRLSACLWFEKMTTKETKNRTRGLLSFKSGMGEFCEKLAEFLKDQKVLIKNEEVQSLPYLSKNFDLIVVATPPPEASVLLKEVLPAAAELLGRYEMRSIASLTYLLQEKSELSGYGCLFPQKEKFNSLGVLWSRDIFPIHGLTPIERWITLWDKKESESQLIEKINKDRQHLYASSAITPAKQIVAHFWPRGLPHMTVEIEDVLPMLKKVFNIGDKTKLLLHGNYLGEMGTSDLIFRSQRLSGQIKVLLDLRVIK
jgi:oxygen-dependent protoporphyrinogen oxidase